MTANRQRLWLVMILTVGALLRIWGIGFGLPELYHQDEQVTVNVAVRMGGTGDLHPHYFFHPHLVHYLLLGLHGVWFVLGRAVGWFQSAADFQKLFIMDPSGFYLLGRLVGVAFGTATIYAVYRLGRRLWSPRVGVWAAGALAVCFLHVRNSHYARHDIPVTFFVVLCLLWWSNAQWHRVRHALAAGLLWGLAIGANWNAGILMPWWLAAAWRYGRDADTASRRRPLWQVVALVAFGTLVGIFIASPYVFLDAQGALAGVLPVLRRAAVIEGVGKSFGELPNWRTYYPMFLWVGLGGPLLGFAFAGLVSVLRRGSFHQRWVAMFPLIYYALISQVPLAHVEYILPIVPIMALMAACGFWVVADALARRIEGRRLGWALGALTVLILSTSFVRSLYHDWLLTRTDTRTEAKRWIEAHIPTGTRVAVEAYILISAWVPRLHEVPAQQRQMLAALTSQGSGRVRQLRLAHERPTVSYELIEISTVERPWKSYVNPYDIERLRQQGIEYVVISSYWMSNRSSAEHPIERRFYEALASSAQLVATFEPFRRGVEPFWDISGAHTPFVGVTRLSRPGPTIYVYRLSQYPVVTDGLEGIHG